MKTDNDEQRGLNQGQGLMHQASLKIIPVLIGLLIIAVTAICPGRARAISACTSGRFNDWQDLGCRPIVGPVSSMSGCVSCQGMPRWWVSEPYENLWMADEPLSYQTSSGDRMTFRWTYRQRSRLPYDWWVREGDGANCRVGGTIYNFVPIRLRENNQPIDTMTNAVWCHNWWSEIVFWDSGFEYAGTNVPSQHFSPIIQYDTTVPNWDILREYYQFSGSYEALVFLGDGATLHFNGTTASNPNGPKHLRLEVIGQTDISGGPQVPVNFPYSWENNTYPDPRFGIAWAENPQYGFRLVYPDGSKDEYGFVVLVGSMNYGPYVYPHPGYNDSKDFTCRAFLTRRIDAQGRITRIQYEYHNPTDVTQPRFTVKCVVDSDGKTNTYSYNPSNQNQLQKIQDPYGRTTTFGYDPVSGMLTSIADAAQQTNCFAYQAPVNGNTYSGWITNLSTPYGQTRFDYYQEQEVGATNEYKVRALLVNEPEAAQQLFLYRHANIDVMGATTSDLPTVPGWALDNGNNGLDHCELYYRNSFHWDRRQITTLSNSLAAFQPPFINLGSGVRALTVNDFRKGRLRHWLLCSDRISVSDALSSFREASPDVGGSNEGVRTWYDYANKPSPEIEGDPLAGCVARKLPDGSSQYECWDYEPVGWPPVLTGCPSQKWQSYTASDGSIGSRTNWYQYADNGVDLVSISNSFGNRFDLSYTNHQIQYLTNSAREVTAFAWDSVSRNLKSVLTPGGACVTISANAAGQYYGFPQIISFQPQGRSFTLTYTNGMPWVIGDDQGLFITNSWDTLDRLTKTSFPDKTYISYVYSNLDLVAVRDRLTNWTTYGYDGLQHLRSITNALTNVTALSWCHCGALENVQDALGNITTFTHNNQGLLTSVSDSDNNSWNYTYDTVGRLIQMTDGEGRKMVAGYNNQGLLTVLSNAYGPVERIVYDGADRVLRRTDADNVSITYQYDLLNRVIGRLWPDGPGEGFCWATNGLVACTNRIGQVTRYARDGAGRLTAVTNANGEVIRVAKNSRGQVIDLWDGRTNHTQWRYNLYGWLVAKTDALGRNVVSNTYNPNGWITNRWTPEFGATRYNYDSLGNLKSIVYPHSTITYAYDGLNRLTNMVDASGTNAFGYTLAGQMQREEGQWANSFVVYDYKQRHRSSISVGDNWYQTYGYDDAWRLKALASPAGTFGYQYTNSASPLVFGMSLPNAASIINHYDALARLDFTGLANRWGGMLDASAYVRDPVGNLTNITRYLGQTTNTVSAGFDNIGQMTSWAAAESTGQRRLNEQFGFKFDASGNLLIQTNGAFVQTFGDDQGNEATNLVRTGPLTVSGMTPNPSSSVSVNGQVAELYGDFTFACTNVVLTTNGYNSLTIIAQGINGVQATNTSVVYLPTAVALRWDSNGNLTNDGMRSFAYDAENQLTNITVADQWKADMLYDGLGRRRIVRDYTWKSGWVLTNECRYVYDGFEPVQERDTNNNVLVTYTRGLDLSGSLAGAGGVGGLLARTDGSSSTFYHADGSGNITALIDGNQNIAARYLYGPFGRLISMAGPMAQVNAYRYSSKEMHRNSGLYYYGLRHYDAGLQRWLTPDPMGERGGINLYQFVGNNPLSRVDPLGLWGWDDGYVEWGLGGMMGLKGGTGTAAEARSGFGEGLSRGGQGVVNDFTGGMLRSENGIFYDYFDDLDEEVYGSGIQCDPDFKLGSNGGRVGEAFLLGAAARIGYKAGMAALGRMIDRMLQPPVFDQLGPFEPFYGPKSVPDYGPAPVTDVAPRLQPPSELPPELQLGPKLQTPRADPMPEIPPQLPPGRGGPQEPPPPPSPKRPSSPSGPFGPHTYN